MSTFRAPWPYYGGKSKAAPLIWPRLGNPRNFVDPFMGSLAILLNRPGWRSDVDWIETVNDKDGYVSNFYRAIQAAPDEVAHYADWPVNENDLHARHAWLVAQRGELVPRLEGNPDYYDARIAGYWAWGLSCWIGTGFCSGEGAWHVEDEKLVKSARDGNGVTVGQLPHLGDAGKGVTRRSMAVAGQLPFVGNAGRGVVKPAATKHGVKRRIVRLSGSQGITKAGGVSRKRPHLSRAHGVTTAKITPVGVARQRPHLGTTGIGIARVGIARQSPHLSTPGQNINREGVVRQSIGLTGAQGVHRTRLHLQSSKGVQSGAGRGDGGLYAWFEALSLRLRRVRVCSGDWTRVMGESVTTKHGLTAVVLDPPYAIADRDTVYSVDSFDVAHDVRKWCIENGDNPLLRIVLCGYEEHESELPDTWERVAWKGPAGYGNQSKGGGNPDNRFREMLYFSPHCLKLISYQQSDMFTGQL